MARFIPTRSRKDRPASTIPTRRLLSGRVVLATQTGATWQDLVQPAPAPTGGARSNKKHPSRKHDVPAAEPVYLVMNSPAPSRQARRAANRTEARRLIKSQRATSRDAVLANRRTPAPSRAVLRWALKQPQDSPLLAEVAARHADLAGPR